MTNWYYEGPENDLPLSRARATTARGLSRKKAQGFTSVKMGDDMPWVDIDTAIEIASGLISESSELMRYCKVTIEDSTVRISSSGKAVVTTLASARDQIPDLKTGDRINAMWRVNGSLRIWPSK